MHFIQTRPMHVCNLLHASRSSCMQWTHAWLHVFYRVVCQKMGQQVTKLLLRINNHLLGVTIPMHAGMRWPLGRQSIPMRETTMTLRDQQVARSSPTQESKTSQETARSRVVRARFLMTPRGHMLSVGGRALVNSGGLHESNPIHACACRLRQRCLSPLVKL